MKTKPEIKRNGFSDYLAHLLNKYHLSQRSLAKRAGLNYVTINRFARGKQMPEPESIDKRFQLFGLREISSFGFNADRISGNKRRESGAVQGLRRKRTGLYRR